MTFSHDLPTNNFYSPAAAVCLLQKKNEIYNWENLVGPFLGHRLVGPRAPPPPPPLLYYIPGVTPGQLWQGQEATCCIPLAGRGNGTDLYAAASTSKGLPAGV